MPEARPRDAYPIKVTNLYKRSTNPRDPATQASIAARSGDSRNRIDGDAVGNVTR